MCENRIKQYLNIIQAICTSHICQVRRAGLVCIVCLANCPLWLQHMNFFPLNYSRYNLNIHNHNIEIKKIPRILSFFYYSSSVMSKVISAAIQRALAKTKYSHLVTGAEFDLTNREVIPKPLHSAIAPVEKFFKPNSSLKWHILDDPEMGMHSVRYSGNTGYAK